MYVMSGQKERAGFGTSAMGWHSEVVLLQLCSVASSTLFTRQASSANLLWHRGWRRRSLLLKLWAPAQGYSFQTYMVRGDGEYGPASGGKKEG